MLGKLAIENLAQNVVSIYNQMEKEMLIEIAKKLAQNKNMLKTDPEAWKLKQLENLGMLDKGNISLIKKYAGLTTQELNKILYNAGLDGLSDTDSAMQQAIKAGAKLAVPEAIAASPQILSILKSYQDQAKDVLNLTNQTMLKNAKKIYIDILNRSVTDVISGLRTPDQALRRTIGMYADLGVPALIDKAGKKWGPEGYIRTVIVSTMHNTVNAMQDKRMDQWGVNLVEVSSHSGARPLCAPYQGRIFRIDGADAKYKNLYTDTSYGQAAGLFGINCGHVKYPYIEGISTQTFFPYPKKENEQVYKESQIQRAHERGIRKAKTKYEMYKAAGDQEGMKQAAQQVSDRQAALRDFIDTTGRTRRRDREQIVKTTIKAEGVPNTAPKKPVMPNPADKPHVEQTITKQSGINAGPGDTIKFMDSNYQTKIGIVKSTFKNGNLNVHESNGTKHKITSNQVLEHIKNTGGTINPNDYNVIDSNFADITRDANTFKNMPREDMAIVNKYTGSYYRTMNNHLRQNKDDESVQKQCEHMMQVLKTYSKPLSKSIQLFRQFDSDAFEYMLDSEAEKAIKKALYDSSAENTEAAKKYLVGGGFEDNAFTSSTYKKGAFGSGMDVKVKIYVPKGYKSGMFVESISSFSSEKEYIFNAGMHFNIFDAEFKNGKLTLFVTPAEQLQYK